MEKSAEQGGHRRPVSARGSAAARAGRAAAKDPSPTYRLAEVYALAGQFEEAIGEYRRFAARTEADPARKARAESEAARLEEAPAPFAEQLFRLMPASSPKPRSSSTRARRTRRRNADEAAIRELQAALLLDPICPAPIDCWAASTARSATRARSAASSHYLRVRPDGQIADTVRQKLKGDNVLGSITVESSWPCKVFINGRETGRSTPLKKFAVPAGKYIVGLENQQFHIVRNLRVDVAAQKDSEKKFNFGILHDQAQIRGRASASTARTSGCGTRRGFPKGSTRSP